MTREERAEHYLVLLDALLEANPYSDEANEITSILRRRYPMNRTFQQIRTLKKKHRDGVEPEDEKSVAFSDKFDIWEGNKEGIKKPKAAGEPDETRTPSQIKNRSNKGFQNALGKNQKGLKPQTKEQKIAAAVDISPSLLYEMSDEEIYKIFDKDTEIVKGYADHYGMSISGAVKRFYTALNHLWEGIEEQLGITGDKKSEEEE